MENNTDWIGIAAVIAASASAVVSIGAFMVSAWNNIIARSTHTLVNSNMEEFKKALVAAGILRVEAAEASGALRGQREEKADQALRDKPTPSAAAVGSPIELTGEISGTVETKK